MIFHLQNCLRLWNFHLEPRFFGKRTSCPWNQPHLFMKSDKNLLSPVKQTACSKHRCQVSGSKRKCQIPGVRLRGPGVRSPGSRLSRCQVPASAKYAGIPAWKSFWIRYWPLYQISIPSVKARVIKFRRCSFQKLFSKNMSQTPMPKCDLDNCIISVWVNLLHIQACKN